MSERNTPIRGKLYFPNNFFLKINVMPLTMSVSIYKFITSFIFHFKYSIYHYLKSSYFIVYLFSQLLLKYKFLQIKKKVISVRW